MTDLLTHLTDTPNSLITSDFNAHSNQWHSPITDHRGDHIASIIQSSSYSILNRNSHTCIPPNQNKQPTSSHHNNIIQPTQQNTMGNQDSTPLRPSTHPHNNLHHTKLSTPTNTQNLYQL